MYEVVLCSSAYRPPTAMSHRGVLLLKSSKAFTNRAARVVKFTLPKLKYFCCCVQLSAVCAVGSVVENTCVVWEVFASFHEDL